MLVMKCTWNNGRVAFCTWFDKQRLFFPVLGCHGITELLKLLKWKLKSRTPFSPSQVRFPCGMWDAHVLPSYAFEVKEAASWSRLWKTTAMCPPWRDKDRSGKEQPPPRTSFWETSSLRRIKIAPSIAISATAKLQPLLWGGKIGPREGQAWLLSHSSQGVLAGDISSLDQVGGRRISDAHERETQPGSLGNFMCAKHCVRSYENLVSLNLQTNQGKLKDGISDKEIQTLNPFAQPMPLVYIWTRGVWKCLFVYSFLNFQGGMITWSETSCSIFAGAIIENVTQEAIRLVLL